MMDVLIFLLNLLRELLRGRSVDIEALLNELEPLLLEIMQTPTDLDSKSAAVLSRRVHALARRVELTPEGDL